MSLQYAGALVRTLSKDFAAKALSLSQSGAGQAINFELAASQHAAYVAALSQCLPASAVTALPASQGSPLGVFVGDAAVVVGGRGLLARSSQASRQGEVAAVEAALRASGLVPALSAVAAPGALAGGDVLWTGREFFCGLSSASSNAVGLEALRAAFPGVRVTGVPLGELAAQARRGARARLAHPTARSAAVGEGEEAPPQRLKDLLTLVGPDALAVADTPLGTEVALFLQQHSGVPTGVKRAGGRLSFVVVPAPATAAANALLVNGTLLVRSSEEPGMAAGTAELQVYAADMGLRVLEVNMSELGKVPGASLTACCLLLQ